MKYVILYYIKQNSVSNNEFYIGKFMKLQRQGIPIALFHKYHISFYSGMFSL